MWFKNFRARRKQNEVYSEKQKKHNNNNHLMDKSNRSFKKKKNMDVPFRWINGACLVSPVSTYQLIFSFQPSISPNFKILTECSVNAKQFILAAAKILTYTGSILFQAPILCSSLESNSFVSSSLQI